MHPFMVNLRYSFQTKEELFIVSEYFDGGDLSYYLHEKKRKFKEIHAKFIVANIIIGLEFLHSCGIIHRDIRPQNLVFDSNGYIKIIDFGLARIMQANNSADTSGTPCYMAPEILFRQPHSYSSDFFAIGVIVHEMMTGKLPYPGPDRISYKEQILKK